MLAIPKNQGISLNLTKHTKLWAIFNGAQISPRWGCSYFYPKTFFLPSANPLKSSRKNKEGTFCYGHTTSLGYGKREKIFLVGL